MIMNMNKNRKIFTYSSLRIYPSKVYRRWIANFLFLLLTFSILHQPFSSAEVRYVSHSGNNIPPYLTWEDAANSIQDAINVCVNGDTIYVANGNYKENLVVNVQIALIGSSMDSTVINGLGLGDFTITFNVSSSIENFNIHGRGEEFLTSRVIRSNTTFTIIKIKNCQLSMAGVGVSMVGGDVIADNLLIQNTTRGFNLFGEIENFVSNCIIILDNENSIGISLGFASGTTAHITNNIILFTGTINPGRGISVGYAKAVYIKNNLISRFNSSIIFDIVQDTSSIVNNVIVHTRGQTETVWSQSDNLSMRNNILMDTYTAVGGSGISLDYNLFWENINNLTGPLIHGDSDRVADPMFVKDTLNPQIVPTDSGWIPNFDYHLQAYSPGIDKGDPNILDVDGSRSDIGLYGGPFGQSYKYKDLAPRPPVNLSATVDTNQIFLKWNRNSEADTSHYNVYRDTVAGFTIDSTRLISSQTDTFFVQTIPPGFKRLVYKITCIDKQGNESLPSEELVINITSLTTNDPMTINDYLLYQNYPNPFNPSTTIGYKLKERGYVKLMVYDIKGELISVLVNKEQEVGYYEVEFNSNRQSTLRNFSEGGLASGIYLYRIEVVGEGRIPVYSDMKKMILLK